ncbi:uncharacterized protein LOC114966061 isoform X2 [Acropora millepora]|uniref:uncharacterized protein LOC114966061 isoform X2 n=1 Tax=Acropora millepora TaxID=45264 RepID=UPI001CF3B3A6|nr:uncharacterized protein LOC114966061 isoform X2 [Acropora millepora]
MASNPLTLYCNKCNSSLATSDMMMLATVPPTQTHVAIRKDKEDAAYAAIRKIPNPNPKKAVFCPYKILCKQCNEHVANISIVEENSLICFKIENVHFQQGYEQIKGKKLKYIKEKLIQHGLEVVNVSQLRNEFAETVNNARKSSQPLVYCDPHLSEDHILSLTKESPREYQKELFLQALQRNTLVYLPTGSGKTLIAAMVLNCMKKLNPDKLMVFLVDRIPLVYQQSDYIKYQVPDLRVEILAGDIGRFPGDKARWMATVQALLENKIDLLVMTSQILLNLMAEECTVLSMSDISLIVFDEAHHCLGNHSYNQIMRDFYKKTDDKFKPLVLALTASPAGTDKLETTRDNLETLLSNLCAYARMPSRSRDLELYCNRPETSYKVTPLNSKQTQLQSDIERYLNSISSVIEEEAKYPKALDGLNVLSQFYRGALRKLIERCRSDKTRIKGLAMAEHAMQVLSVNEVNNILGHEYAVECFEEYIKQLQTATSPMEKLKKTLVGSLESLKLLESSISGLSRVSNLFITSDRYKCLVEELETFTRQVKKDKTSRGIIFVKMRKTAYKLCTRLRQEREICQRLNPAFLVGHGQGSDGMDWRGEQEEILNKFRSGEVKLLVSTSVLEEGLDVPACNQIIRFDSRLTLRAIVQGRGRAARRPNSQFVIICSDDREEALAREAVRKEAIMEKALQEMNVIIRNPLQAKSFDCQLKKPDFSQDQVQESTTESMESQPKAEEHDMGNDFSVETLTVNERGESLACGGPEKRRKNYVPRIAITVHNVLFGDESKQLGLLTDYFEEYLVANSIKKGESMQTTKMTDEIPKRKHASRCVRLELEPSKQGQFNNKDKFFDYVAESWCSRPTELLTETEQLWLRRDDTSQKHKDKKPVLVIKPDVMSLGYFRSESQYCQHWPIKNSKLENIRIAFQHDLKTVLIWFTVQNPRSQFKADLYKLQIHYNELQEYILVNRPRLSKTDLYLSLRQPPRMFKAKSFVRKDHDVNDDYNVFEDWYYGENDYDSGLDHENIDEFTSESEDSEALDDGVYSTADHSKKGETPDNESLLASTETASIDDVINWERVIEIEDSRDSFGSCCTYNFTFKPGEWNDMKDVLATIPKYDKKVFYASVTNSITSLPEISIPNELPSDVKYATQCVLHSYPFIRGRITSKFNHLLSSRPEPVVKLALARLGSAIEGNSFCDPEAKFERLLEETNVAGASGISKQLLPSECAMIKRMVVTPTRLLFFPPEMMSKNRVLRNFDTDQFLCANVRDEDFSRLSSAAGVIDKILERLQTTLDNGVMAGGQRFLYLGSSNNQLRNHGFWFVRPRPYPQEIREWMGDFSSIRCVGTFMARIGQCFSTSMDAVGIDVSEGTTWKMDIEKTDGSYCFSDGVGRISQSLAQQVAETIELDFTPSAIQIRFAGFKGVLALDPKLSEKTAVFRPSMRKFESPHRRLEVLQTSRPQPVFLNHQLIILLSSLGIPDEVFINLQRRMLDRLAGMLVDEKLATQQLASGAKTDIAYKRLSEAGLQLTNEPFFKSLLVALYKERMQNLLKRARILLPTSEARLMIGVMDETGILEPGQVFVQYSLVSNEADTFMEFSKSSRQTLTGPVVVTRNPCLHPGDVRQLTAVSVPQLAHFVDCIVFPNHGPRPHPSEMAGGDLDGDMYFVSWMTDLLPRRPSFPPMNYKAPLNKEDKEVKEPITVSHMTKYVVEYIRYDKLGVIGNAHKAQADSQKEGVKSSVCLDLAERHSRAVDAPKTGDWPDMPKEAKVTVFPDFMMKSDKPSYASDKVLGKLYRECRAFKNSIARDIRVKKSQVDPGFLVPGFQEYQQEARETYEDYSNQLQALMNLYGIETEGELISGCFSKFHSRIGKEKFEIAQITSRFLKKMRQNFREKFFEEFDGMVDDDAITLEMQKKASAWYYVAYGSTNANNATENTPEDPPQTQFLSFPWLVDDVILRITLGRVFEMQESGGLVSSISESVFDEFEKERDTMLLDFQDRIHKKNFIRKAMPEVKVLAMFGSSATFLFRKHSDLDLCILSSSDIENHEELEQKEQITELKRFLPTMRKLFKQVRMVESATVPVIIGNNPAKRGGVIANVKADLTASCHDLLKSIVLSNYIKSYPVLLPILRLLVHWGDVTGIAGHGVEAGIKSTMLVYLMLIFCVSKGLIENFDLIQVWKQCFQISTGQIKDLDFLQQWKGVIASLQSKVTQLKGNENTRNTLRDQQVGEILLTFFQEYNAILDMEIPHTFASLLGVSKLAALLDPDHLRQLKEHMQRAFHHLALYRDAEVLLTVSASEIDRVIFLSETLSYAMARSERHNASQLSKKTGARVTIRPSLPGSAFGLVLQAIGTEFAVAAVERQLHAMATQRLRIMAKNMTAHFMKEAKQTLFEGCLNDDHDRVSLVPYYGNHHSTHDSQALFVPLLSNQRTDLQSIAEDYTRHEFLCFQEKFLTQAQVIARDFVETIHGKMEFATHFGRLYVLNIPKSFTEDSEPPSVGNFQTNLSRGYKPRPSVLSVPRDREIRKYGKTRRSKSKGKSLRWNKKGKDFEIGKDGKKIPKEKASRSSFFTLVSSQEKAVHFLTQKGFSEAQSSEFYSVEIHTDHEFDVVTDKDFNFQKIKFPKLRWCAVDIKRAWKENPEKQDDTELDGVETDVRFILQVGNLMQT